MVCVIDVSLLHNGELLSMMVNFLFLVTNQRSRVIDF